MTYKAPTRQEITQLEQAFKVNLSEDNFYDVLLGKASASTSLPGEDPKITSAVQSKSGARIEGNSIVRDTENSDGDYINENSETPVLESLAKNNRFNPKPRTDGILSEVEKILSRFEFSTDEEKKKRQLNIFTSNLRTAMQNLIIENIAINTKEAFKQYVKKVVKIDGGLKVYFVFDKNEVSVSVKGLFFGDETIGISAKDGKLVPQVFIIKNKDSVDVSNNFSIEMSK
jgi:hypothetical protein